MRNRNGGAVTTSYHYQLKTPWGTDPMFIRQGGVYGYYVTDHLGTPQRVVGSNGAVLWGAVYDAFGEADLEVAVLTSNLRFPGQYYDAESGLHYNYWRYYDSGTGGYVRSDPIGLDGGVNTYAYVGGNPVGRIDPMGLDFVAFGGSASFFTGGFGGNASARFGVDTNGSFCGQVQICGRAGAGASGSGRITATYGTGNFCEGNSASGGFFAGGGFGPFGSYSANTDANGNVTTTVGFGAGGGFSAGGQACITRTFCF
ncbi:MAG: hypothetical protein GY820_42850 [Gammaproteobacteria bacterium]|nr:hypothetical protein [Gammaproteobacteria bacterium]